MKKIFILILPFLWLTLSAGKHRNFDFHEYENGNSIEYDSVFIVEEIAGDSFGVDNYALCDTLPADCVEKRFSVINPDGSEFEYQTNSEDNTAILIGGNANGISNLVIPSYVEIDDVCFSITEIGEFAFANNRFDNYYPLKGVKHLVISEGIRVVGQNAFDSSPDLEIVDLPSSLIMISFHTFGDCHRLKEIRFPEETNLFIIESYAFSGCGSLESFTIPRSVMLIEGGAWSGCASLQNLALQDGNDNFDIEEGVLYQQGALIQYPVGKRDEKYQIKHGTMTIIRAAFEGNHFIEEVYFPASVESIFDSAFFNCSSLRNVMFSDQISFIGDFAFAECANLKEIELFSSPEYVHNPNSFTESTIVRIREKEPDEKLP